MSPNRRIAVLGAGIMGSSVALLLARRGDDVVLIDKAAAPMSGASRWNEGKIHLGYLYGADPSLATARHVMPGGLAFDGIVRELIGTDPAPHFTSGDDIYLIHRRSVVEPAQLATTFAAIDDLLAAHDRGAGRSRLLSPAELARHTASPEIVAGFAAPERSIDTNWLADRLAAAVAAEPRITLRTGTNVVGAQPVDAPDGAWRVAAMPGIDGTFDLVINALWEGRLAVDVTAGLSPPPGWSHRYRLCLFVTTARPLDVSSALVAVGPFGDVKNYDGTHFYISWYPAGLRAEGRELTLPLPPQPDAESFVREVRAGIGPLVAGVGDIIDSAAEVRIGGGFVFAQAQGALDDAGATIHRRDRFGVRRHGSYLSVDTGKFSTAPWLAQKIVTEIAQ
jgi:hypothetical protein